MGSITDSSMFLAASTLTRSVVSVMANFLPGPYPQTSPPPAS